MNEQEQIIHELVRALRDVLAVADRETEEFARARAAIAKAEAYRSSGRK